ncbi:hypothetical protein [Rahnella sp. PCH160]|uniref:hypothetical protein n=1 Tax=Rahnella sp. PCH160 TaxID=3447928 RepID=UPI0039FD5983
MTNRFNAAALSLALSFTFASIQAAVAEPVDFTPAQQARIGEIATDYLVAHPQVLIEMSKKLQAQQAAIQAQLMAQSALKGHRLLMQLDGVPVKGPQHSKSSTPDKPGHNGNMISYNIQNRNSHQPPAPSQHVSPPFT